MACNFNAGKVAGAAGVGAAAVEGVGVGGVVATVVGVEVPVGGALFSATMAAGRFSGGAVGTVAVGFVAGAEDGGGRETMFVLI